MFFNSKKNEKLALKEVDFYLKRCLETGESVNKVLAIKAWRQHSGCGLKEAKAFIDQRYDEKFSKKPATLGDLIRQQLNDNIDPY